MCDFHQHAGGGLAPLAEDEFVLGTPVVRDFIAEVRDGIERSATAADACATLRPAFAELLSRRDWLPEQFQQDVPASGMGGGIGQWLLFRSADRSLCLFSLVVPPGSKTPIHDHLAWGIIGLYRGNQDEEIYRPGGEGIELTRQRPLLPGDHYVLLPPVDDVHCVRTTSDETSVSIHLLANDTGCVDRHTYDEKTGAAKPFRSGYANAACAAESEPQLEPGICT
jgi:predicted metal-dependent enzyme (double-stranded beta helix superfamily)